VTATQQNLASLSRFIFRVPQWYASLALALLFAAGAGVIAFDSAYPLDDAWRGVFFIGLPTVIASFLTTPIDNTLGGQLTSNSSSLLALICEVVLIAVVLVAGPVSMLLGLTQEFVLNALIVGLASIFALRLFVIQTISQRKAIRSMVPASIQTVAAAVLLFIYSGTLYFFEFGGPLLQVYFARPGHTELQLQEVIYPFDFVLLAFICVLHAVAVIGFLRIIDWPWKSSLGVSVLDFLQGFIGYLAGNTQELEDFFVEISEEAIVPITILSIRRKNGDEKARFVLPMVHPGPMGNIGGGNLPIRLAESTDGMSFAPHATAGHDFNLVTKNEVETIVDAVETAETDIEYTTTASKSVQQTAGEATMTGQAIGETALAINTFAPNFADDVEFSVGQSTLSKAQSTGLDDVLLVDAHNCNDGLEGDDIGHIVPGSRRSYDMLHVAEQLGEQLQNMPQDELQVGIAWDKTPWEPEDGFGPLGIRVAVFEVDGHRTAYILIDGNNMVPGLRQKIIDAIDGVDLAEVMTSDTHVVNSVEAENQVGQEVSEDELIGRIQSLVEDALDDVEPVEAGMTTERAEVAVFGNDRTETLASHANAMLPMATGLGIALVFTMLSVSTVLFLLAEIFPV
jgi:putative membrane protein